MVEQSSIKIEITGEAATMLAKLPELLHAAARLNHEMDREREERTARREAEARLREEAEQERLERQATEADGRRQQHLLGVLALAADVAKLYFDSKKNNGEPEGYKEDPVLLQLRNEVSRLAPRTNGSVQDVLQNLKYAHPKWLPAETVDQIVAIMRSRPGIRDAEDLLEALGEDPGAHQEAIRVLDAAFGLALKRQDPGFMCMDYGERGVDPMTHHEECKDPHD